MRVAIAVVALALLPGCRDTGSSPRFTSAAPPVAKKLLTARLRAEDLTVHWIACVKSGRNYRGATIVRCNVNFGDPHIEAYCSLLRAGRLVTDHDDPAIPCQHDGAGWNASIVGS
ncbi:MAG: hypothetical protein ABR569_07555 [Gaiellaceae bacterium]